MKYRENEVYFLLEKSFFLEGIFPLFSITYTVLILLLTKTSPIMAQSIFLQNYPVL